MVILFADRRKKILIPLARCASLTYASPVQFDEFSGFTKRVLRLLDDESYAALQIALVQDPELGKLIQRSSGLRKVRWALPGRGKSGGVRVIYYFWGADEDRITFCDIYPKNEKENISQSEIETLKKQIDKV